MKNLYRIMLRSLRESDISCIRQRVLRRRYLPYIHSARYKTRNTSSESAISRGMRGLSRISHSFRDKECELVFYNIPLFLPPG